MLHLKLPPRWSPPSWSRPTRSGIVGSEAPSLTNQQAPLAHLSNVAGLLLKGLLELEFEDSGRAEIF